MPFSDGSSGVIEKVLLPFDDLNLKEGTVGFLRTPEDVAVHLSVLSAQGPQGPKLVGATANGALIANPGSFSHNVRQLVPLAPRPPGATILLPEIAGAANMWMQVNVTATSGANPEIQFWLQESVDGVAWSDFYAIGDSANLADGALFVNLGVFNQGTLPLANLTRLWLKERGTTTSITSDLWVDIIS